MNDFVGKPEKATQKRIIGLFRDVLGWRCLGDWTDRADNNNIEEKLLADYLTGAGYSTAHINAALFRLRSEASNTHRSL
jgi:type I restriction enzyme R subunit